MRDPDLLLTLLGEMADEPDGRIQATRYMGMDDSDRARLHHLEILEDAGHAERVNEAFRKDHQGRI